MEVVNPRIEIIRHDEQLIESIWRQFAYWPTFAMTIQKIQGQIKKVGVWLEELRFTQGQLYDATSREVDPQHLHLVMNNCISRKTLVDVVYK